MLPYSKKQVILLLELGFEKGKKEKKRKCFGTSECSLYRL